MEGQIAEETQTDRIMRLVERVNARTREKSARYVGREVELLCEDFDKKKDVYLGRDVYGRMGYFKSEKNRIGDFVTIRVTEANGISLYGEAVN